jgi:hypothetical protein
MNQLSDSAANPNGTGDCEIENSEWAYRLHAINSGTCILYLHAAQVDVISSSQRSTIVSERCTGCAVALQRLLGKVLYRRLLHSIIEMISA